MEVSTNLKYKIKTESDGEIILYFPKEIEIIEETLLKSFSQFGNPLKSSLGLCTRQFSHNNAVGEVGGYLGMILGFSLLDLEILVKNIRIFGEVNYYPPWVNYVRK